MNIRTVQSWCLVMVVAISGGVTFARAEGGAPAGNDRVAAPPRPPQARMVIEPGLTYRNKLELMGHTHELEAARPGSGARPMGHDAGDLPAGAADANSHTSVPPARSVGAKVLANPGELTRIPAGRPRSAP